MSEGIGASEYVERRIAEFYRPDINVICLGGNPFGVHMCLRTLHEVWSYINGTEEEFDSILRRQMQECECNTQVFCDTYKSRHPDATVKEVAAYEVAQWRSISLNLGLFAEQQDFDSPSK